MSYPNTWQTTDSIAVNTRINKKKQVYIVPVVVNMSESELGHMIQGRPGSDVKIKISIP